MLLAAAAGACAADAECGAAEHPCTADASAPFDGGAPSDAAQGFDAGKPFDAGAPLDAGPPPRAPVVSDRCARAAEASARGERPGWQRIVNAGLAGFVYAVDREEPSDAQVHFGPRGLAGIAYGSGQWLVVGAGNSGEDVIRWATSKDGLHWDAHAMAWPNGRLGSISRVFRVQERFVFAVQSDPLAAEPSPVLYTSADGHEWTSHPLPAAIPLVSDLASDGERVVLAAGNLWSSTDLESWTETTFDTGNPRAGIISVAFGDGRWVASGVRHSAVDGALESKAVSFGSVDAIEWNEIDLPGTSAFNVMHAESAWLAFNSAGEHRSSPDGLTFFPQAPAGAWHDGSGEPSWRVRRAGSRFLTTAIELPGLGDPLDAPSEVRVIGSAQGLAWAPLGSAPGLPLPDGATGVEYEVQDFASFDCRCVAAGSYRVTVPGALDTPLFTSEIGPFVIIADLAPP